MIKFKTLAFTVTDKCSAACKICCFSCSPTKNTLLDKELIKDYIVQASEFETFKRIAFTGGEAILFFDQLKECIVFAHDRGFKTSLVSNGFWAKDEHKGYAMIKELVEAGLTYISLSIDKFHQEYVPYETVSKAISICEQFGVLRTLSLMDTTDNDSITLSIKKLRGGLYNKKLVVYPALYVGGATENIPEELIIREYDVDDAVCLFDKELIVLYDGTIMMCCSQFSPQIDITKTGVFGKTSLKEAMENFNNNNFLYVLLKNNFKWYADAAKNYGLPLRERYSTPCELCSVLFTNREFVEYLRPLVKKESDRLRIETMFKTI